jgi:predicted nucleic acid-binding protein
MRALLDVKVLIALHHRNHVRHIQAATLFEATAHLG